MRRKLTDNDMKDIRDLAYKGCGVFTISRKLNIERSVVDRYIKEHNIVVTEGKVRKITPEDGEKMIELMKEGSSVKELAECFGYRKGTVERYLKKHAGEMERRGRKRTRITPVVRKKIIELYKAGKGITFIVAEMHSNKDAIMAVLKEAGLKVEDRSTPRQKYESIKPIIAQLYDGGYNTEIISKEVHIGPDRVCRLLKEMGYVLRAGRRVIDIDKMDMDKKKRIISLGQAGNSIAYIIKRTGLSHEVVRKVLISEGLFTPRNEQIPVENEAQEDDWQPRYNRISLETFEMMEFNKAHQVEGIKVKPIKQEQRIVKMRDGTERMMEDLIHEFEAQQVINKN